MSIGIRALDQSLLRPFAFRTLPLWLIFHIGIWMASKGETLILSPLATGGLASVAAIVGLVDARRRHELLFLRNLGVHPAIIGLTCAATVVLTELFVALMIGPLQRLI